MSDRGATGFLAGFVLGALLGAAVASLITPERSGGQEMVRDLYSRGKGMIDTVRADLDAAVAEGRAAAEAQREALGELDN